MKKRYYAILVLIPLLFIAIPVARILLTPEEKELKTEGIPVQVEQPLTGKMTNTITYTGHLTPFKTVQVTPKVAGALETIFVKEGSRIEQGEKIAQLEDDDLRLQMEQAYSAWQSALSQYRKVKSGARKEELQSAKASLKQAKDELETAKNNLDRSKRLYEAGTISKSQYEEAQNSYNSAKTEVENAQRQVQIMEEGASPEEVNMARSNAEAREKQYELAKRQFEHATITAPVSGTIIKMKVDEGNMISRSMPVAVIIQDNPVYAEIPVPEKYYSNFQGRVGNMKARINPIAYPDKKGFPATVTNIPETINAESRTFSIKAEVQNQEGLLRPGMYVEATIILDTIENTVIIPASAIVNRNGRDVVYLIQSGNSYHAKEVPVKTGLRDDRTIQIIEGLSGDEQVIIQGNTFLEEGQQVKVVE